MTGFATVIWMYSNSGQVMSASLLAICSTVPYLVVSLFGGAVADKMNKKNHAYLRFDCSNRFCHSLELLYFGMFTVMGIVSGKCDQWIYECISKSRFSSYGNLIGGSKIMQELVGFNQQWAH